MRLRSTEKERAAETHESHYFGLTIRLKAKLCDCEALVLEVAVTLIV
jgi:hypothetical protein